MKKFLSINEFSKLSGIGTTTLRYWDEIGLFSPVMRNPKNKYRYYAPPQIIAVNFITVLGNLGIPLKTIDEVEAERNPETIIDLIEQQEQLLNLERRRLQEASAVIHIRRELIKAGSRADPEKISVEKLPERMITLGPINDSFTEESGFYLPFMNFCNRAKEMHINLNYPIGGYHETFSAFVQTPSEPQHFFSLDPAGNKAWSAGDYLIGYQRGNYGEFDDSAERMAAYATEHGLSCTGPVYVIYLHDEICMADPDRYLSQISIKCAD